MVHVCLCQLGILICSLLGRGGDIRLGFQACSDILNTLGTASLIVQRVQKSVLCCGDEMLWLWRGFRGYHIYFGFNLTAVLVQGEVVHIVAEGIFDLAAYGCYTQNDIGANDRTGYSDPPKSVPKLERQGYNVDPGYLADGDGISDRKWGVENAFCAGETLVK